MSSLVRVRNSRPSTPTQSPKSSSLKISKVERRQRVLPDVGLDGLAAVGQHEEVRLPERADPEDPAARDGFGPLSFQLVVALCAVSRHEHTDGVLPIELVRVDLNAELLELGQVQLPLRNLLVL